MTRDKALTTREVADRFHELAQQEKWFEIQDELFAENVRSIEPPTAKGLPNAQGKAAVRKKGESLVSQVEAVHKSSTTAPVVVGNFFAVGRDECSAHLRPVRAVACTRTRLVRIPLTGSCIRRFRRRRPELFDVEISFQLVQCAVIDFARAM
jgi:hypothetical protein